MMRYLDIEKIVSLDLDILSTDSASKNLEETFGSNDVDYWEDKSQYNTPLAENLSQLFSRTNHLRQLTLSGDARIQSRLYYNLDLSNALKGVQTAILGLHKLHTLTTRGKIFHPSFFIAPPINTRRVAYTGCISHSWIRQFQKCAFTNVTDLTGMEQAISRKNKGLDSSSKRKLLASIAPNLEVKVQNSLLDISISLFHLQDDQFMGTEMVPIEDEKAANAIAEECFKMMPTGIESDMAMQMARHGAEKLVQQGKNRLWILLSEAQTKLITKYNKRFLNGEEVDEDQVVGDWLRLMMNSYEQQDVRAWAEAQSRTDRVLQIYKNTVKKEIQYCVASVAAERFDLILEAGSGRKEEILRALTKECARELSLLKLGSREDI
ncbi:hypothetical protein TWF281_002118 [Arthrobotrys megalospora]